MFRKIKAPGTYQAGLRATGKNTRTNRVVSGNLVLLPFKVGKSVRLWIVSSPIKIADQKWGLVLTMGLQNLAVVLWAIRKNSLV